MSIGEHKTICSRDRDGVHTNIKLKHCFILKHLQQSDTVVCCRDGASILVKSSTTCAENVIARQSHTVE